MKKMYYMRVNSYAMPAGYLNNSLLWVGSQQTNEPDA